jgi:hypothetical protein
MEDEEEVSDFAVYFAKQFAGPHSEPSTLCNLCNSIPIRWLLESPRNGYTLFDNTQELRKSDKTCGLCRLIHRSYGNVGSGGVERINIGIAPQFLIIEAITHGKVDHSFLRLCADPGTCYLLVS